MYLSPRETVSQGEHSVVYKAEWELPRNVLVDEYICHTCVMEDANNIPADGKNRGHRDPKWDVLYRAFIPDEEFTEDGNLQGGDRSKIYDMGSDFILAARRLD